jgi:hypothetical protein
LTFLFFVVFYYLLHVLPFRLRFFLVPRAGSVDALMESMKTQCPSLSGVYERSDAMLAVYPGEGARFAKHIDNTTGACAAVCVGHFALVH